MKSFVLIALISAALSVPCAAELHPVLYVAHGEENGTLMPIAVTVDDTWASINPSASPSIWMLKEMSGRRMPINVKDLKQTSCGPVLVTDHAGDLSGTLAMNPGIRVSYFKPLSGNAPLLHELTAAVKGKGHGKWSFQVTEPLVADWTVYGYQQRLENVRERGTLYGLIIRHGRARLDVFDVGEAYESAKGVLPGGMVGLFVWNKAIYLVEDQQNGDAITSRLILVDDHPHEVFKRECVTL